MAHNCADNQNKTVPEVAYIYELPATLLKIVSCSK